MNKVILITGASSGFGEQTAYALADAGHTVYASMLDVAGHNASKVEAARDYSKSNNVDLRTVELDVLDQASVDAAVSHVIAEQRRIDVLVHNAGHMVFGPSEAFTPEQLLEQYDVNTVGSQRVNRAALPHMRKARSGLVVWVSSTSARGGVPPYLGPYFASKAGMDSLAVTYSGELARWGIETSIIVPGVFPSGTRHFETGGRPADESRAAEYADGPYADVPALVRHGHHSLMPEETDVLDVSRAIVRVVDTPFGKRPLRVTIDPSQGGAEIVNMMSDRVRSELLRRMKLDDLLRPRSYETAQE